MSAKCLIWGTDAVEESAPGRDARRFNSPRAGGRYQISGTAEALLAQLDKKERAKLTTWLVDQRRMGVECPEVNTDTLDRVKLAPGLTVQSRLDRFLLFRGSLGLPINASIRLRSADQLHVSRLQMVAAWAECIEDGEIIGLAGLLSDEGLTKLDQNNHKVTISAAGWRLIETLKHRIVPTSQGFIAMWFNPSTEEVYRDGIAPAVIESGYRPMRIDKEDHINKVDDEIIAEIRQSRFVVADFTSEREKPRGGVYFEAGFAMGLNIPVFWTCRSDLVEQLHFDTRQFNHIAWDTPADLKVALRNRIVAVLGKGPHTS